MIVLLIFVACYFIFFGLIFIAGNGDLVFWEESALLWDSLASLV